MRRYLVPAVILLLLLGLFGWWWNRPERVVARRIAALFDAATVEADAGNLARATRGNSIEGFLAPNVAIDGPEEFREYTRGSQSRSGIVANYTFISNHARRISFEELDVESVELESDLARAQVRVDAIVEARDGSRPADGILKLAMEWTKIDGAWRLSSVHWREVSR